MNTHSQHIIIMGVCGCGKSTLGTHLAQRCNIPFFDGDEFHPQENIDKMQAHTPLNDNDRFRWLNNINNHITQLATQGISSIFACSALRAVYRTQLMQVSNNYIQVLFIWLDISITLATKRVAERANHFMPTALVQSQFDTLEVPDAHKEHITLYTLQADTPITELVDNAYQQIRNSSVI